MDIVCRFQKDEKGAFLVFFAIALAVLIGTVALSFDLGRAASTQTDLQSFADNVALAAAGELDGKPDSMDRAWIAAEDLVEDTQTFADGDRELNIDDVDLTFMDEDWAELGDDESEAAVLVRADISQHEVTTAFASVLSLAGASVPESIEIAATATAGFTQYACDVTPLMFCLPPEGVTNGQMIHLVAGGGSGAWGPGNFGFLDISDAYVDPAGPCRGLNGANRTRCVLGAADNITACYSIRGVDTKTGSRVGITTDPLNFRFDMFPNSFATEQASVSFAPAPNIIRGFVPDVRVTGPASNPRTTIDYCTAGTGTATTMALPRDSCFASGTCAHGNRFGNSVWDRAGYITMNHNGTDPASSTTSPRTRYQMYLDEIEQAGGASSRTRITPATTSSGATRYETGRSQCSAHQSGDVERRILIAAGINCDPANGGTEIRGDTDDVPVEEFFRIFLTEPVGTTGGSGLFIYGEVVGTAGRSGSGSDVTGGIFRDVVQLYR